MPSPFPRMDPFLEDPALWPDVHSRLITVISDMLTAQVAPHFVVRIEQRVVITDVSDPALRQHAIPDVYPVRGSQQGQPTASSSVITAPTLVEPLAELELRDRYLEIHDTRSRAIVTTIEILSPFNKSPGTSGREAFLLKRQAVMASPAHWIEIDLLRTGERPPEVAGKSHYYALLKRGDTRGPFEVWYANVRDPLPIIGVPLRSPIPDVPLDLQAALATIYERARYADDLDYTRRIPAPVFQPADLAWIQARIRAEDE